MGSWLSFKSRSENTFLEDASLECALHATQGSRRKMEDRHTICLSLPKHPTYSLFGIMDGFNGHDAATYFSQNILQTIDDLTDLEDNQSIIDAIHLIDSHWIHPSQVQSPYNVNSGCTFVFALIHTSTVPSASDFIIPETWASQAHNNSSDAKLTPQKESKPYEPLESFSFCAPTSTHYKVRIFWAGDSRATLMSHAGSFQHLTEDHHCALDQEAKRIRNANGSIINNRIDGTVETTRAFGCYKMKNNNELSQQEQKMIATPEQTSLSCATGDRLILYCDGLVKKWSESKFEGMCTHYVLQHDDDLKGSLNAMMYMAEQAMDDGSKDNITVLCVKFK